MAGVHALTHANFANLNPEQSNWLDTLPTLVLYKANKTQNRLYQRLQNKLKPYGQKTIHKGFELDHTNIIGSLLVDTLAVNPFDIRGGLIALEIKQQLLKHLFINKATKTQPFKTPYAATAAYYSDARYCIKVDVIKRAVCILAF